MAKTDYQSIDEYIAAFAPEVQIRLQELRAIIREAVPDAVETIGYQIPCFQQLGPVVYFSAHKKHLTLSSPPPTFAEFAMDLAGYKSSVSAVQFPFTEPLPAELIARIAQYVRGRNLERKAAK